MSTRYLHIRSVVDWAHHDGILRAEWARTAEFDATILDAVALDEAARCAERDGNAAGGAFVRAYVSTRRAHEIEDRDRYESARALWRERTGVTS